MSKQGKLRNKIKDFQRSGCLWETRFRVLSGREPSPEEICRLLDGRQDDPAVLVAALGVCVSKMGVRTLYLKLKGD